MSNIQLNSPVTYLRQLSAQAASFLAFLTALLALASGSERALAATIPVAGGDVDALKAAITTANTNGEDDVINLAANSTYTLTTTDNNSAAGANGLPVILADGGHSLTINGNGSTIARSPQAPAFFRILCGGVGADVALSGLTLASGNGQSNGGGAIFNDRGSFSLSNCTFSNNFSSNLGGAIFNSGANGSTALAVTDCSFNNNNAGDGGAIANGAELGGTATLTVTGCTFNNNFATGNGGAISHYGGNGAAGAVVTNSTFASNSASINGGAISNQSGFNGAITSMQLINCTLSANSASGFFGMPGRGGGLYNNGSSARAQLGNTLLSLNHPGNLHNDGGTATITSLGNNLSSDSGSGILTAAGDKVNTNPLLDPAGLQPNGGYTRTIALQETSPARNAANNRLAPATDQRGMPRPAGNTADIGAFELHNRINGLVRTSTLAPIAGVSVQLSNSSGPVGTPVLTNASGFYDFGDRVNDTYTITPSKDGWNFSPVSTTLNAINTKRAANFTGTRKEPTYSLSGRIANVNGQAMSDVSVSLTPAPDGVHNPVRTNSAGYYTFYQVPAGDYVITPALGGFTFTPPTRSVTVANANVAGQSFVGRNGARLHGRVLTADGAGLAGVSVTRSGSATPAITNSAGYYNFYNVPAGNVTLTPTKAGYIFTPTSKTLAVSGTDLLNQNFVAATGYTITGRIADSSGKALANVEVALQSATSGAPVTLAYTNSAGYYTFTNVTNGNYIITPSPLTGDTTPADFAPQFRSVTVNNSNLGRQDFIGLDPQG